MLLEINNLTFSYPDKLICENLNFNLQNKMLVIVIGRNGSGKTTLLKNIAGLLKPDRGEVNINSTPIQELSILERARHISFLPQTEQPTPLKIRDYLALGMYRFYNKLQNKTIEKKIIPLANAFGLTNLLHRQVSTLSTGEQRLTSLARTFVQQADLMIADEPTAGLDLYYEQYVFELLKEYSRKHCVLISTHALNTAKNYATHFLLLHGTQHIFASIKELTKPLIKKIFYKK